MKKDIQAFPMVREEPMPGGGKYRHVSEGMTLRDYFAAKALSNIAEVYNGTAFDPISTARTAYQFADAMLAARDE